MPCDLAWWALVVLEVVIVAWFCVLAVANERLRRQLREVSAELAQTSENSRKLRQFPSGGG